MENKTKSNTTQRDVVSVQVGTDLTVQVIPNTEHEFLMTSRDVAIGYGISEGALRVSKHHHDDELIYGTHFTKGVTFCNTLGAKGVQPHQIFWTKQGVIRLGLHIKSDRAILFRDWAEKIIMNSLSVPVVHLPTVKAPRKHNLLAKEKLADLLIDVCQIPNNKLRMSILSKLTGEAL